ncbi:hypothetical protein FB451DRAFT_1288137 [Mycena latifolia]|nr:hypothetical protein FB451DRAFT_1288137 [Mycena latifolia]
MHLPPSSSVDSLIQDTVLAASQVQDISNSQETPVLPAALLGSAAALSQRVCQLAQKMHELKGVVTAMRQTLRAILDRYQAAGGALSGAVFSDIKTFVATLEALCKGLECEQSPIRINRIFQDRRRKAQIDACASELRRILERLGRGNEGVSRHHTVDRPRESAPKAHERAHSLPTRALGVSSFERWLQERDVLSTLPRLGFKYVDEDKRRGGQTVNSDDEY